MFELICLLFATLAFSVSVFLFFQNRTKTQKLLRKLSELELEESQKKAKLDEYAFLNSLDEKVVHQTSIKKNLDTLCDSLGSVLDFSTASYMIIDGKKIYFRMLLNESISKNYIEDIKKRLLNELKALVGYDIEKRVFEESVLGKFVSNESVSGIKSFYTIQLSLGPETVGLFNIASTQENKFDEQKRALVTRILGRLMDVFYNIREIVSKEQDKLAFMVENMEDGFLMLDPDLKILHINAACFGLLNVSKSNAINIFDLTGYFSSSFPLEEKINKVFESGQAQVFKDVRVGPKYLQVSIIPITTSSKIDSVGVIIHDLTEEESYKRSEMEFTAMMVHELRSPLTVIKGMSDMLIKNLSALPKDQSETILNQMKSSATNMLDIVNDLLDTAKAEAGKLQLAKNYFDLNKILMDEVEYYKNAASDRGLFLTPDLDTSVGMLNIDSDKIKQVLNNLISNSLKFTERGGSIYLTSRRQNNYIEVSVVDTGKGISDAAKAKLFSKFTQFKDRSSTEKGTGLGLVISKGIVEAHGGRIWVEDNIPRGTKFIFTLPI